MITRYDETNAAKYDQLFEQASLALGAAVNYSPVYVASEEEFSRTILDGVTYYTDFKYTQLEEEKQNQMDFSSDFLTERYYTKEIHIELDADGKEIQVDRYVRALQHTPDETYYTLSCTAINEDNAQDKDNKFDPEKEYYIAISAIQTLEEYFCQLKALLGISYKYIMLPLDEPPFDINANTRTITVPANFKTSSGLSVEGEQMAEMLFFRIDRFFDAMDLASCDISVKWKLPGNREYITMISMLDVVSEAADGKFIFACPITSEITEIAGPIEFSVNFTKLSGSDSIAYRFSTLPITANISASLKLTKPEAITESSINDLFKTAIENSEMAVGVPAAKPQFSKELGAICNDTYQTGVIYLNQTSGDNKNKLTVEAITSPAGNLEYTWYFTPYTGGVGMNIQSGKDKTIITLDPDSKEVAGTYQVKVLNRNGNKTSKSWSNVVTLPPPQPVKLANMSEHIVIESEDGVTISCSDTAEQSNAAYTYTWKYKAPKAEEYNVAATHTNKTFTDTYIATEDGWYCIDVTAKTNGVTSKADSTGAFRVTKLPATPKFDEECDATKEISVRIGGAGVSDSLDLAESIEVPEVDKAFKSDEIIYRWFIDDDSVPGVLTDDGISDSALAKEITVEDNKSQPVFDLSSIQGTVPIRCVVENWLNNKVARAESALYIIIAD